LAVLQGGLESDLLGGVYGRVVQTMPESVNYFQHA
jgi:hypothetical protein